MSEQEHPRPPDLDLLEVAAIAADRQLEVARATGDADAERAWAMARAFVVEQLEQLRARLRAAVVEQLERAARLELAGDRFDAAALERAADHLMAGVADVDEVLRRVAGEGTTTEAMRAGDWPLAGPRPPAVDDDDEGAR